MRLDIKVNGNMIDGRQGWAYICNSMRFAVLKADMDKEQKYDDFKTFGKVRVAYTHRGHESFITGRLEVESGKWMIGSWGCMLKGDFGFFDKVESIATANLQTIRKDDVVAISLYSVDHEIASLLLFKVGSIDSNCQTVTTLKPLTDEEMAQVKADAERWCNSMIA